MTRPWAVPLAIVALVVLLLTTQGTIAQSTDKTEDDSSELPIAEVFSPPLGFRDGVNYGPLVTTVDSGATVWSNAWRTSHKARLRRRRATSSGSSGQKVPARRSRVWVRSR